MAPRTDFPPVRACLFDMDGLLINTEDLYTICHNRLLSTYSSGPLTWDIKEKLQGRPALEAIQRILTHFNLTSLSPTSYASALHVIQEQEFTKAAPLPGVEKLLEDLKEGGMNIALATSSHLGHYQLKTAHLQELFSSFPKERMILGGDPRIPKGRGKPCPDIYLLALASINATLKEGEDPIRPEECLVFEDGIPGVVAGRKAGMRVVWCPHPGLGELYKGKEELVLAGKPEGEEDGYEKGEVGDGWAELRGSLVDFPYEKCGIVLNEIKVE